MGLTTAEALYDTQARLMEAAVADALRIWGTLDPTRLTASWVQDQIGDQLFISVARSQELAALAADVATDLILLEQGIEVRSDGSIVPAALSGVSSDGRPLDSLLLQPLIQATALAAAGASPEQTMAGGANALARMVGTQVQDSGRNASGLGIAARPKTGWVRLVESGACSRCAILAGRWYRWSNGFDRHPLCKCRNIPAAEDTDELTSQTDPMTRFNSLSEADQNRQFTKAGAQAIRDGADINRVVNSRRGAMGLNQPGALTRDERRTVLRGGRLEKTDVYGRPVYLTSEGTTIRSDFGKAGIAGGDVTRLAPNAAGKRLRATTAPRLMPESIYQIATDREDAVRLLRLYGYLT